MEILPTLAWPAQILWREDNQCWNKNNVELKCKTTNIKHRNVCSLTYPCIDGLHWGHPTPILKKQQQIHYPRNLREGLQIACKNTYLDQLDHIRMVQLLEDGDFLVHPLQRAFGLRLALWGWFGPSGRRSSCIVWICRNNDYLRIWDLDRKSVA